MSRGKIYARPIPDTHPRRLSGRYQIDKHTTEQVGTNDLRTTDYSPRTQDVAFVAILQNDKIASPRPPLPLFLR